LRQAMRLSPRDLRIGVWHMQISNPELGQGHYDAAIEELQKAIDAGYRSFIPYAILAATYALEGKMDEAKSPLAEARRLNPNLTVKWYIAHSPNLPAVIEGLRKAGLPEE
jgi:tetratricopeptide (TPR) repeat protein